MFGRKTCEAALHRKSKDMEGGDMIRIAIAVSLILTLCCGCASTGFLMASPKVTLFSTAYPPKPPDSTIDVYRASRPQRDFIELAEISCGDTDDDWNMRQIMLKAREIGADGVIILGQSGSYGLGVPIGNMVCATQQGYGIKGHCH